MAHWRYANCELGFVYHTALPHPLKVFFRNGDKSPFDSCSIAFPPPDTIFYRFQLKAVFGKSSPSPGFGFAKIAWGGKATARHTGAKKAPPSHWKVELLENRFKHLRAIAISFSG
jgi:hypothetical protein